MGTLIQTECRNCEERFRFHEGIGKGYWGVEDVLCHTRGRTRRALQEILETKQVLSADYGHRLFTCPQCETLHERFYVRVDYHYLGVYETTFVCGECRTELVERSEPVERHRCPSCHETTLFESGVEEWD